jgi:hypothetical protein
MPLPTLLLPPDSANYNFDEPDDMLTVQLDGGRSRSRLDKIGSATEVNVQWQISAYNYNYLKAFFRTTINRGVDPFNITLILDDAAPASYVAKFKKLSTPQIQGLTYTVSAILEVVGNPPDATTDNATVAAGPSLA